MQFGNWPLGILAKINTAVKSMLFSSNTYENNEISEMKRLGRTSR